MRSTLRVTVAPSLARTLGACSFAPVGAQKMEIGTASELVSWKKALAKVGDFEPIEERFVSFDSKKKFWMDT